MVSDDLMSSGCDEDLLFLSVLSVFFFDLKNCMAAEGGGSGSGSRREEEKEGGVDRSRERAKKKKKKKREGEFWLEKGRRVERRGEEEKSTEQIDNRYSSAMGGAHAAALSLGSSVAEPSKAVVQP